MSLFCLYHLGREDFVLMRRNVSLEDLFNLAFIVFFSGLFFSRLFYVILNFAPGFLNPLVFFLVPYFPGMSFIGGLIGGLVALIYFSRRKKWPTKRIFDLMALSFLAGLPLGFVGSLFVTGDLSYFLHFFLPVLFFLVFLIMYFLIYPKLIRREIKPAMLGTSTIIVISFVILLVSVIFHLDSNEFPIQIKDIPPLVLFVSALVYFIKQDLFVIKVKK